MLKKGFFLLAVFSYLGYSKIDIKGEIGTNLRYNYTDIYTFEKGNGNQSNQDFIQNTYSGKITISDKIDVNVDLGLIAPILETSEYSYGHFIGVGNYDISLKYKDNYENKVFWSVGLGNNFKNYGMYLFENSFYGNLELKYKPLEELNLENKTTLTLKTYVDSFSDLKSFDFFVFKNDIKIAYELNEKLLKVKKLKITPSSTLTFERAFIKNDKAKRNLILNPAIAVNYNFYKGFNVYGEIGMPLTFSNVDPLGRAKDFKMRGLTADINLGLKYVWE